MVSFMSLGFEFKRILRFCLWSCAGLLLSFVPARADELHLKDGTVVEAEEVWEVADAIWYRQGKVIASFAKTDVVRIARLTAAPAAKSLSAFRSPSEAGASAASGGSDKSENGDQVVSHKISRIMLKGGTQIDADAVWE